MEDIKSKTYNEVYNILNLLGKEYIRKIPKALYSMIEENAIKEENSKYKSLDEINKSNINKSSIAIIALIHLSYWCESDEEKEEINKILRNNEKKNEIEKREKYNPDNIFKEKIIEIDNANLPVEIKQESLFRKIIEKITFPFNYIIDIVIKGKFRKG